MIHLQVLSNLFYIRAFLNILYVKHKAIERFLDQAHLVTLFRFALIHKNILIQTRNFRNLSVFNAFKFIKMRFAAFDFSFFATNRGVTLLFFSDTVVFRQIVHFVKIMCKIYILGLFQNYKSKERSSAYTNPHALAGTTKHETLAKLKEWS
jgi:hypothetical protein